MCCSSPSEPSNTPRYRRRGDATNVNNSGCDLRRDCCALSESRRCVVPTTKQWGAYRRHHDKSDSGAENKSGTETASREQRFGSLDVFSSRGISVTAPAYSTVHNIYYIFSSLTRRYSSSYKANLACSAPLRWNNHRHPSLALAPLAPAIINREHRASCPSCPKPVTSNHSVNGRSNRLIESL